MTTRVSINSGTRLRSTPSTFREQPLPQARTAALPQGASRQRPAATQTRPAASPQVAPRQRPATTQTRAAPQRLPRHTRDTFEAGTVRAPGSARTPRAPATSETAAASRRTRDTYSSGNPRLDAINATPLRAGADKSCVKTTRANLQRAGMQGLPVNSGGDGNHSRGTMVQMLRSNHWQSAAIPGSSVQTIDSPAGRVQAHVLSGEAFEQAARNGQIPEGAVVFQTKHGWQYGKSPYGSDMGIARDGGVFNYKQNSNMAIYRNVREAVVLLPR
ncbi:hypothetical protein [Corallococcus silvisoli]|uniref:hypothetical protein n=1 Tax=Corallococcus silvisoli TaxID=2697031 RepID=UPI001377C04B|nr:hypothetical protein [Corallococcus silvisoli]NBD13754.1 hypothetical protein [Corallococcus silvisoli]